jgi:hypothetical protein
LLATDLPLEVFEESDVEELCKLLVLVFRDEGSDDEL